MCVCVCVLNAFPSICGDGNFNLKGIRIALSALNEAMNYNSNTINHLSEIVFSSNIFTSVPENKIIVYTNLSVQKCIRDPGAYSLKSLGYICSISQKYILWVKIIDFSFMPKIIRILNKDHVP